MLDFWVIRPIDKLIEISRQVSLGIFSNRISTKKGRFQDEFDILYSTFNKMLDNTEYSIEEIKNRETFLQKLIDAIPDGIRVIDKEYNVIMANKAFHNILNLKNHPLVKNVIELMVFLAKDVFNANIPVR